MRFGLEEHIVDALIAVFEEQDRVDKAIVFGSRAKGNYRPDSDIDIAIKGQELHTDDIIAMSLAFEEKGISHEIDLIDYDTINEPDLKEHIDRVGVELYRRWKEYRFCQLLVKESISYGIVQPGSHMETNSTPILKVSNIKNGRISTDGVMRVANSIEEKHIKTRLVGGELLITVVGSVGECAIVPDDLRGWNVARAVSVARIKDNYDKRFIKYSFSSRDMIFQMYGKTNDTVQPTLNLSSLKELKFILPPLQEQKAIANILGNLDKKIDLLHRQNETLEKLAETLFRQRFVEENQDEWEVGTVNSLTEIQSGFAFKSKDYVEYGKYSLITIRNVQDGYLDLSNTTSIDNIPERMPEHCTLKQGDILLSLTGNVGRCCLVTQNNLLLNQRVAKLKPKNQRDWAFVYINFRQKSELRNLEELAKGTAQPNLSPIETGEMEIRIPPIELLERFSEEGTPLIEKVIINKKQIDDLTQTRNTLLPKLICGEVRVTLN